MKYSPPRSLGRRRRVIREAVATASRLIDEESADSVLSDDTIVKVLRDSGIDIARRTVAKYREALKIPSSVQRRLDKALDLPPEADPADAARSSA
jgi:hypothetical protein